MAMADKSDSFGEVLSKLRKQKGLSQKEIADPKQGLSASNIAMLESPPKERRGRRDRPILTRRQVWHLAQRLDLWPPECDELMESAGYGRERTAEEELYIQRSLRLRELWVFTPSILEQREEWFELVAANIQDRKVTYRYFIRDLHEFEHLRHRLESRARSKRSTKAWQSRLECTLLPEELFIASFAIYNPGTPDMYCCLTKHEADQEPTFYTVDRVEAVRLQRLLSKWRSCLDTETDYRLSPARRVFPDRKTMGFIREERT